MFYDINGSMTYNSAFDVNYWDSHWESHWSHEYSLCVYANLYAMPNSYMPIVYMPAIHMLKV